MCTGSERLFKTDNNQSSSNSSTLAASNNTRMEGKYINLSLHFLEQVIVALQEKGTPTLLPSFPPPFPP